MSNPIGLAFTQFWSAIFYQLRREELVVQEQAEALITLADKLGFPHYLACGTILLGWARAARGQEETGITLLQKGIAATQVTGENGRPYFLALLAEAYGKMGKAEEGLAVLADALATAKGDKWYEAELYRLKGELLLQKFKVPGSKFKVKRGSEFEVHGSEAEAEACFLKAIDTARKQQAKSWELRAATSLARLWRQQGKKGEAHKLLTEIYHWFTEGFATKDLQEAKTLLEELS